MLFCRILKILFRFLFGKINIENEGVQGIIYLLSTNRLLLMCQLSDDRVGKGCSGQSY